MDENESSDITQKIFCFEDLKASTRDFCPDSVVDKFGYVYKGWIDGQSFAVAKPGGARMAIALKRLDGDGFQSQKEWLGRFQAEINYMGRLDHPNLVKVIGYCFKNEYRLLVYEFMAFGSLENNLFRGNTNFPPLTWNNWMKIALDAANGLAFLHRDEVKLIYRDFKTSNILLDSNYTAKISDFGLRLDGSMGTIGYAAPEYIAVGLLTDKSDVYSFGAVFLEILTGRRALDRQCPVREQNLVNWTVPFMNSKRKLLTITDPRIQGQNSVNSVQKAASLAMKCLSVNPKLGPNMSQVVALLEHLQNGG